MTSPLLDVNGLSTRFRTRSGVVNAVRDVTYSVGRRELVGIIGESGSGKSVTIRSILGLVAPPGEVISGTAVFDGVDLLQQSRKQMRAIRGARIGFVAQNPFDALSPLLPIRTIFHHLLRAHGRETTTALSRDTAVQMLGAVGIRDAERAADGYAFELSGGMAQRVVIALALVLEPSLVIADEPTTALDVTVQKQILDLMVALVGERGSSMLIVTHDLGVVAQYCQSVVVMLQGEVVEQGPVSSVFVSPQHPYTRALLASSVDSGPTERAQRRHGEEAR